MTYRDDLKRLRTALKKAKADKLVSIAYNIASDIKKLQFDQGRNDPKLKNPLKEKVKKKKKPSRSFLVKKLDAIFSKYIRLKYADKFGMVACYTSGVVKHRKEMQCGHFITRGCYALRRSEINCRPQCYADNVMLHGNYIQYTLRMIGELGEEVVNELRVIKNKTPEKIHTRQIEEQIEYYNEKVYELEQNLIASD